MNKNQESYKPCGHLLDISQLIFSKTFNSKFSYIEVWITGQNSKPLEMEHERTLFQLLIKV